MRLRVMLCAATALVALLPAPAVWASDKAGIGTWGVDTAALSKTVRPADDFYRYVNEGWLKTTKIPAGLSANDAFTGVYLSTEQRVADIIKEAREGNDAPGSAEQLIADFHRSHSDMAKRNALGLTPIASTLATIGGLKTREDLARAMAMPWMDGMVNSAVGPDSNNPKRQIVTVAGTGTSLPSRDYYLTAGEPYEGFRKA